MSNDFNFDTLFGNLKGKSNCDTCGYKAYSDKLKRIKAMMIAVKKQALQAPTRAEYLELVEKGFNRIGKEVK